jgi:hypothetical protein
MTARPAKPGVERSPPRRYCGRCCTPRRGSLRTASTPLRTPDRGVDHGRVRVLPVSGELGTAGLGGLHGRAGVVLAPVPAQRTPVLPGGEALRRAHQVHIARWSVISTSTPTRIPGAPARSTNCHDRYAPPLAAGSGDQRPSPRSHGLIIAHHSVSGPGGCHRRLPNDSCRGSDPVRATTTGRGTEITPVTNGVGQCHRGPTSGASRTALPFNGCPVF